MSKLLGSVLLLTESERSEIGNALRAAAYVYEGDAEQVDHAGLCAQFLRQAQSARELAERIEGADVITTEER